jgi:hypothetical protein
MAVVGFFVGAFAGRAAGREVGRTSFALSAEPTILGERPTGLADSERDARPFVATLRHLIEDDRLSAARALLEAAPLRILSDPLVTRLRSVLAPPVAARIQKQDVDRRLEYEWLRTQGQRHRGRWVALEGNTLLASAPNLRELREQLKARHLARPPLIHRVD